MHLNALQRLATDGGSACDCMEDIDSGTGLPDANVRALCELVRKAPSLLRTICEARIWGRCHELLLQEQLSVYVSDTMALVPFDL